MKAPVRAPLPKVAQLRIRRLLVRLAMLAVLVLSLWLLWWSLFVRLAPVNRQYLEKTRELSGLGDELDQKKSQWPAPKLVELEAQYRAAQARLFADAEEIAEWGRKLKLQTAPLGLETTIQMAAPLAGAEARPELAVTRASLNLVAVRAAGATNASYQQLLNFARSLEESRQRIDLLEFCVDGQSNAIQQAGVVVQLWLPERKPR